MNDIIELFRLPKKAQVNQRVFTKDIVAAADAKGKEKTLLEKSISTVYLVGVLNENTTGLWAFDDGNYMYREIQVYLIALKDASKVKSLNEELQRIFPNPAVMIYTTSAARQSAASEMSAPLMRNRSFTRTRCGEV